MHSTARCGAVPDNSQRIRRLLHRFEGTGQNRILPMEGMRGVAALLVFLVHFRVLFARSLQPEVQPIVRILGSLGHSGVDIFFLLSGYLMYGIVLNARFRYAAYLGRRLRRLYPVFAVVFALYVVFAYCGVGPSRIPSHGKEAALYLLANLFMLPGMLNIPSLITVAWSLSYEWFFYLLLPLIIAGFQMRRRTWRWRVRLVAGTTLAFAGAWELGFAAHPRLVMFAAGVLLWEAEKSGLVYRLGLRYEGLAAAGFVLVLCLIGFTGTMSDSALVVIEVSRIYVPGLFISGWFLAAFALFRNGILQSLFSWSPLRWIGNMSYSYYLIHGPALHGVQVILRLVLPQGQLSPLVAVGLFIVSVAVTLVCGAALYLGIEYPLSIRKPASAGERKPLAAAAGNGRATRPRGFPLDRKRIRQIP